MPKKKVPLIIYIIAIWTFLFIGNWLLEINGYGSFVLGSKIEQQTITVNRLNLPAVSSVKVSAFIGGYIFDIEGLTSPKAKVEFYSTDNISIFMTIADENGVFRFNSLLLPVQTGDFCFLSYDTEGVANNPLCFSPPPPQTRTQISGIVLSPSFSLDKGIFKQNEQVTAQGRTFPNAEVQVFMFEKELNPIQEFFDVIVPAAIAREGPSLTLTADQNGSFAFNLPTQKSTNWRLFVGPKLTDVGFTAKSNILEFSALSWWKWFLIKLLNFLAKIFRIVFKIILRWEILAAGLLVLIGILTVKIKGKGIRIKE